jgi:hypothetical protein
MDYGFQIMNICQNRGDIRLLAENYSNFCKDLYVLSIAWMKNIWWLKPIEMKELMDLLVYHWVGMKVNRRSLIERHHSWYSLTIFVISEVCLGCGLESVLINYYRI